MNDNVLIVLTANSEKVGEGRKIAIKLKDILWIYSRDDGSMIRLNDENSTSIFVNETIEEILEIISEKTGTK